MRKWKIMWVGAMLALGAVGQASAATPTPQQVKALFQVMHLGEMFGRMNSQMTGVMGQALPCVPASYWSNFIDASGTEKLLDRMVPVYQSKFSADDVTGLIKFYKSPLGQKVINQMPSTMAEGMKIGQQWGRDRGLQMIKSLQDKGTLNEQGQCPATARKGTS